MSIDTPLTLAESQQVIRLTTEIAALNEALQCVTHGASPSAIYGRIDSLIAERREARRNVVNQEA